MSHRSENAARLVIYPVEVSSLAHLPTPNREVSEVWLLVLPFGRTINDALASGEWFAALRQFALALNDQSVVAILTSSEDAAETWLRVNDVLQFQLWVAIKTSAQLANRNHQLPSGHAALLILSRYRTSLSHTKTRIGYSYCPYCDKTTKDYGGKKHTYHEYGTLISDVWRDIKYSPGGDLTEIVTRLADLFGMSPYHRLAVANLASVSALESKHTERKVSPADHRGVSLDSLLIKGDCLAALRRLPANSVDFCFADPPYNLAKRYDSWDDAIDLKDYLDWCESWTDELARVLRPGRTCAILNIPVLAIQHFKHMKRRLRFQYWIAWEGLSLPVRMIMPAHYAIVCFSKGASRPLPGLVRQPQTAIEGEALSTLRENYCLRQSCSAARRRSGVTDREPITDIWWDIHRLKHNSKRVEHPCQLPPTLMFRLIALFTHESEIVLDPFNGAGTTTLCAQVLRRRYVGIELSEKYYTLAESRHELLKSGGDPFAKNVRVPSAKNSRVRRIGGMKYDVPKRTLQLEVKRVAHLLGRLPTREELRAHGRYPITYFDEYFVSWGEVCAAARTTGMSETRVDKPTASVNKPTVGAGQFTLWDD